MAFEKLKFWKREEADPSFEQGAFPPRGDDPFPTQQFAGQPPSQDPFSQDLTPQQMDKQYPAGPSYAQQPQWQDRQEPGITMTHRDIELVLAKLDAIRSELDALHQRVRKIEQATDTPTGAQKRYW